MVRKHNLLKFAAALVFLGAAAMCFGGGQQGGTTGEIVLKVWKGGMDKPWRDYYQAAITRYLAKNPEIKDVEFTDIPWPDYQAKASAAFASGTAPDILANAIAIQARRAVLGQVMPLDEYLDSWEDKDKIMDRVWESGTYHGQIYGIGYHWDPRVLVWR